MRVYKNFNSCFTMYTSFSFGLLPEAYMPFDPIIDGVINSFNFRNFQCEYF